MPDLSTKYMGLSLKNPLIIGSSGLTSSPKKIKEIEGKGAGAVVLKSIFEEEIIISADSMIKSGGGFNNYWDAENYINNYVKLESLEKYKKLISDSKNEVSIPVIASINCSSAKEWTGYAETIEKAGADALELNIFIMPTDSDLHPEEIEKTYFSIAREVQKKVKIPVSLKIGYHFTAMARMILSLSETGISGLVLFNRFYNPDIDIKNLQITNGTVFSNPSDISLPLRWIGMLSHQVKCDLAASTGIHTGEDIIKVLLAGASAAYVVSSVYINKTEHIGKMLKTVAEWMDSNKFQSIDSFKGKLCQDNITDPVKYERAQFMKYYSGSK